MLVYVVSEAVSVVINFKIFLGEIITKLLLMCVPSAYNTCLQAQQDALNKQHQAEKDTAKTEIFELHQRLEEVCMCALPFIVHDYTMISCRHARVFGQSNTPGRRSSSHMLK